MRYYLFMIISSLYINIDVVDEVGAVMFLPPVFKERRIIYVENVY